MKSTKECKGIALIWLVLLIVAVIAILSVGVYFLVRNINNGNTDSSSISLEGQDQGKSNNVESSKKVRKVCVAEDASFLITEENELYATGEFLQDSLKTKDVDYTKFTKIAEDVKDLWVDYDDPIFIDFNNTLYSIGAYITDKSNQVENEYYDKIYKVIDNVREVNVSELAITIITESNELYTVGVINSNIAAENSYHMQKIMDNAKTAYCSGLAIGVVDLNDDLYVWNGDGLNDSYISEQPEKVFSNVKAVKISYRVNSGHNDIFIFTNDDELYAYGENHAEQFGISSREQVIEQPVKIKNDVKEIFPATMYTIILTNDDAAYGTYMIGEGSDTTSDEAPNIVKISDDVVQAITDLNMCYIVTKDGGLYQVGDDETYGISAEEMKSPTKIYDNVKQISGSSYRMLILTSDGEVYAKGNNKNGILGVGNTEEVTEFTKVEF